MKDFIVNNWYHFRRLLKLHLEQSDAAPQSLVVRLMQSRSSGFSDGDLYDADALW